MKKTIALIYGIALLATACSKEETYTFKPVDKVSNIEDAQDVLDKKTTDPSGAGSSITLEIPKQTGASTLQIPESLTQENTPEITLKLESGFELLTVSDKNSSKQFNGTVNIVTSSNNTGALSFDLPGAVVTLNGKYNSISGPASIENKSEASTSGARAGILVIAEQAQVDRLAIASGIVKVYGVLNTANVNRNSGTKLLKAMGTSSSFATALEETGYDGVILGSGTYSETSAVQVNRPFVIYGPNHGVNPNTKGWTQAERKPEAVLSVKFDVNRNASDKGDIIVDGVKFTGDTYIKLAKHRNGKHVESRIVNCVIENTESVSNGFFYVWTPAETIEFSNNRVIDVKMSSAGSGDNSGVLIWRTDNVSVEGNYFSRTSDASGMTSNAALDISANEDKTDVISELALRGNYVGTGLCVKLKGKAYPTDKITGNTFAGGRGDKGCFVLFLKDFSETEANAIKNGNTFLDDSALKKKF